MPVSNDTLECCSARQGNPDQLKRRVGAQQLNEPVLVCPVGEIKGNPWSFWLVAVTFPVYAQSLDHDVQVCRSQPCRPTHDLNDCRSFAFQVQFLRL